MLITQKNLKKCIKSFDTIQKYNYNTSVLQLYTTQFKMKGGI